MKTLTRHEWKKLYAVWRVPYLHLRQGLRTAVVRGCATKALYESYEEARNIAVRLPPRAGLHVSIYYCDICSHFHIGNTGRRTTTASMLGPLNGIRFPTEEDIQRIWCSMTKKLQTAHVVVGGKEGEIGHCTHCGAGLSLLLPQPISDVVAAMNKFTKDHAQCERNAPPVRPTTTPEEWLLGRDTGISSKAIYCVMRGIPYADKGWSNYPRDPDDFGRCYRLLQLFPAWRPRLPEVAAAFPDWKGLIDNWDELTALYEEELPAHTAPKLYARMKELIRG